MQRKTDRGSQQAEVAAELVRTIRRRMLDSLHHVVVGLDDIADQLLVALFARGHVLMEGVPGTAKTTLCKSFAQLLGIAFQRIQFTPDLLPSDVTGTYIFDRNKGEFVLRKGPIFTHILLADELNRAPAKTQSALLEAMQERQSTIEGTTLPLPSPFMVLATQNPIEQEGVYRLPEAQLDRFLLRVSVGYPDRDAEIETLTVQNVATSVSESIADLDHVEQIQKAVAEVFVSDEMRAYIIDVARASREHPDIALGASPRAALCLMQASRARALLEGNTFVTHRDVQEVAESVLGHRVILRPEAEIEGRDMKELIQDVVARVPVNTAEGNP